MTSVFSPSKYNPNPYGRAEEDHPLAASSPSSASSSMRPGGSAKTEAIQKEVDAVRGIMQNNIDKMIERDGKLSDLSQKTDDLQAGALQFRRNATSVRKRLYWKNIRLSIFVGVLVLCLLGVLTWVLIANTKDKGNADADNPSQANTPAPAPAAAAPVPAPSNPAPAPAATNPSSAPAAAAIPAPV